LVIELFKAVPHLPHLKLSLISPKAKLRPSQRHRLACRKVAEGIWEIQPEITIADMIIRDEIVAACEGKIYAERTIRNWINDLCPNRSPGRRPMPVVPN